MIIGIDMDGCLVDFVGAALPRIKSLWGIDIYAEDLTKPRIEKSVNAKLPFLVDEEALCKALFQPGFFSSMLPRKGAVEAVKTLHEAGHTIVVITKAYLHSSFVVAEKADWLAMHLRGIPYQTIVVRENASKLLVNVDVLVDDDPENLEHPTAISMGVRHPWNKDYFSSSTRKRPVHKVYSMDALPWMINMATQVTKELDQFELEAYLDSTTRSALIKE
jgi:5'(3')-deoxyribonucleotidase